MNIAQVYYNWRKTLGAYSQAKLADDMMVSRRTAENWCSGKTQPPSTAVRRIEREIQRAEFLLGQKMPRNGEG